MMDVLTTGGEKASPIMLVIQLDELLVVAAQYETGRSGVP
jgi:hypothetical protein